MISTSDLAQILLDHHGANPEDAALCAGLIIDHRDASVERPLVELITAAKHAYPLFFKRDEPAAPSKAAPSMSVTERVAQAAKSGSTVPDSDVMQALAAMRGRHL